MTGYHNPDVIADMYGVSMADLDRPEAPLAIDYDGDGGEWMHIAATGREKYGVHVEQGGPNSFRVTIGTQYVVLSWAELHGLALRILDRMEGRR